MAEGVDPEAAAGRTPEAGPHRGGAHVREAPDPRAPGAPASETWTILRMILWSAEYLEGKGVERARLDAEHLLAHALGLRRLDLYLQFDRPLEPSELDAFRPELKRRAAREPLQYILGHQPFRELDLQVDRRVLIPRPETEVLVEQVLERARTRPERSWNVLDVGTGSGAVALSLATEGRFARVVATDVSAEALEVAAANRAAAGLEDVVELRRGPDFDPVAPGERFHAIVSNPPYVEDTADLEPEVAAWEPPGALFGGSDGLDVVRRLVREAPARLEPRGLLALEVGASQAGAVAEMLRATGAYDDVIVKKDLAGRERIVLATLASAVPNKGEET